MSLLSYFFGNKDKRILKSFSKDVKAINNLEEEFSSLSDDELRNKTLEFKEDLKNGKVNPMMAVMSGKLKIKGDQGLAMKLQAFM